MIWIWDAGTGKPLKALRHAGPVIEVAISPDGSRIASCSKDKTACLWNTETGLKMHNLWAQNRLACATYAPNGLYIVTGEEIDVVMWSIYSKSLRQEFREHSSDVLAVAVSPDSARIVSGSKDKSAIIWNAACGEILHTLTGHTGAINAVAFSPDGHTIVTASRGDKTVGIWHTATGKLLGTVGDKTTGVNSVAFLPDGNGVLLGQDDNTATVRQIQPVRSGK